MDPSTLPTVVPDSTLQGRAVAVADPMEQNQNYGIPTPVNGVKTTPSFTQQSLQQQPQDVQDEIPNLCCCCELKIGLVVMAVFDVLLQAIAFGLLALDAFRDFGIGNCGRKFLLSRQNFEANRQNIPPEYRQNTLSCDTFYVGVMFFVALAITASILLIISCCVKQKTMTLVSHVVGWIPIVAAAFYASIFLDSFQNHNAHYYAFFGILLSVSVTIGLSLRIYQSVVIYYYWKEIPGQYSRRNQIQGNAGQYNYGQTNYGAGVYGVNAAPLGHRYRQSGYSPHGAYGQPAAYIQRGAYGQPAGYGQSVAYGQPAVYAQPGAYGQTGGYGTGGYGGFIQPGYGGGGYPVRANRFSDSGRDRFFRFH